MIHGKLTSVLFVLFITPVCLSQINFPAIDERWTVTVNGQIVRIGPDGNFLIENVSSPDLLDEAGGPNPDGKSDDFFQAIATATIDGQTWYAYSDPFQMIRTANEEPFHQIDRLKLSIRPPAGTPEAIRFVGGADTLWLDGTNTAGFNVIADYPRLGTTVDVTLTNTTYRTSNPGVATVGLNGGFMQVTGVGIGQAFITATHLGATAVKRFNVTANARNTTLIGRVVNSGGQGLDNVKVTTDVGTEVTSGGGLFEFSVLYLPFTPFSIVARQEPPSPPPILGAVLTDVTPVPNGVTDVGTIVLGADVWFWKAPEDGNWFDWFSTPTHWFPGTGSPPIPPDGAKVYINAEDFDPTSPRPTQYFVTLDGNKSVNSLTLDSPAAIFKSNGANLTVTDTARFIDGKVEWTGDWLTGTFRNEAEVVFSGFCDLKSGVHVVNDGMMGTTAGSVVYLASATFDQESAAHDLEIVGQSQFQVIQGGVFATNSGCKGVHVNYNSQLLLGEGSQATFNHDGGTLTVDGLLGASSQTEINLTSGVLSVSPTGSVLLQSPTVVNLDGGVIDNNGNFMLGCVPNVGCGSGEAIFNFNAGAIFGKPIIITDATLNFGPLVDAPASFQLRGTAYLGGPVPQGQTIIIQGQSVETILSGSNPFINNGVIHFDANDTQATLHITGQSSGLVNNGIIEIAEDATALRRISAHGLLENTIAGTIRVESETSFYREVLGSNGTLSNAGRIQLASRIYQLATYTQTGDADLSIEISGTAAGQFGTMELSGELSPGGTLSVSLSPSYNAQFGDEFTVVTYDSRPSNDPRFSPYPFVVADNGVVFEQIYSDPAGADPPGPYTLKLRVALVPQRRAPKPSVQREEARGRN